MYSRQNRNGRDEISVELPRDYSGNAFTPFPMHQEQPMRGPKKPIPCETKIDDECSEKDESPKDECCEPESVVSAPHHNSFGLSGLKGIFGGNIGLEELLLLGVIFLIFTDDDLRDNELLICLLLILFI